MLDKHWTIRFKGYFPVDDRMEDRLRRVCAEIGKIPDSAIDVDEEACVVTIDYGQVRGWFDASKEVVQTVRVGERLVVKPPWDGYEPASGEIILEIDPGTSFGSGMHESTRLCLRILEGLVETGVEVVDFGTGTGVLAIAAAKLGASQVTALEADEDAVEAARANIERNGVQHVIEVIHTNDPSGVSSQVDLVTANITAETISRHLDALSGLLKVGGTLIASGMTDQNIYKVEELLPSACLKIVEKVVEGRWVAVVSVRH